MSSTTVVYADLRKVKQLLGLGYADSSFDAKIQVCINRVDEFVKECVLSRCIPPITNPDSDLVSYASSYAVEQFLFTQPLGGVHDLDLLHRWKGTIQHHIDEGYCKGGNGVWDPKSCKIVFYGEKDTN